MGYQPKPEDSDYPGKLQRRAEAVADGAALPPPPPAADDLPNASRDDTEVRMGCLLTLFESSGIRGIGRGRQQATISMLALQWRSPQRCSGLHCRAPSSVVNPL